MSSKPSANPSIASMSPSGGQLSDAVPLQRTTKNPQKPMVWPINPPNSELSQESPSSNKCVNTSHPDGVCCRDLFQEERTLIDPDIVRDV